MVTLFRQRRWRIASRAVVFLLALLALATFFSTDHLAAFGGSPDEATLTRMRASKQFKDGAFQSSEPTGLMSVGMFETTRHWLFGDEQRAPLCPLPLFVGGASRLRTPSVSGLRVTWLGHSTTLIEIDGSAVLTDPIWSDRASPSTLVGPRRFHPPPLAMKDLPHLDAVLVSHEHYDHLDMETVRALAARGVPFHVPLGIGAHLLAFGVPKKQIVEHDWWENGRLPSGLEIVSTPGRHFNGRGVPGRVGALWTSWSLVGSTHRVFVSGDTGLTEAFREIQKREGPFDLALLEIGQYDPAWGDIHLGPQGALDAFAMLGAKHLLPIHWATFELGFHAWSEPAETVTALAQKRGVSLVMPMLGEPVEPTVAARVSPWWRSQPPTAPKCP